MEVTILRKQHLNSSIPHNLPSFNFQRLSTGLSVLADYGTAISCHQLAYDEAFGPTNRTRLLIKVNVEHI
jgi:hypothetical protein